MPKIDEFVKILRERKIVPEVIYDIGAFDGEQTLELARAFPEAKLIYAFEPVVDNFRICQENVRQDPRIMPVQAALSERPGYRWFNESTGPNKECGSLLVPNGKFPDPMPMTQQKVLVLSGEQLVTSFAFEPPAVIWMDVQGNELAVLKGMGKALLYLRAFWAEITYQPYYFNQMLEPQFTAEVKKLGFTKVFEAVAMPGWFGDAAYVHV